MGIPFKGIIFFLIILFTNVCYAQNQTAFILVTNKNECKLSRITEQYFERADVKKYLVNNNYKLYKYYGQDIPKRRQNWGIEYYPTILKVEQRNGTWYKMGVLNPNKTPFTFSNVRNFLGSLPIIRRFSSPPPST